VHQSIGGTVAVLVGCIIGQVVGEEGSRSSVRCLVEAEESWEARGLWLKRLMA
jgi:hypothetical protein